MKNYLFLIISLCTAIGFSQAGSQDYQKKVLESVEIDFLMSAYKQTGLHAAVTGGIGNEDLSNYTPTIVVKIPLSADEVLTADVGLSAYTSASSSNGNPFNKSGASGKNGHDDDDEDDGDHYENQNNASAVPTGSPWVASSGASYRDVLTSVSLNYAKSSKDRNTIWNAKLSTSIEYDYRSFGLGVGLSKLLADQNAEISFKGQVFLDRWLPVQPTEIHEFLSFGNNFLNNNSSYFNGIQVIDSLGSPTKSYLPVAVPYDNVNRNSWTGSILFSQIISSFAQVAFFGDFVFQSGLLSNPLQRVYFADKANFFIGDASKITQYSSPQNTSVFHLADDVERLPNSRTKIPLGARLHLYLNEQFVVRSYYRYYWDNWGIFSNTFQIEIPIKFGLKWKLTPTYRYYDQMASTYFAPYDAHLSTEDFYTSDYDLSGFSSNQYGLGIDYTDLFTSFKILNTGLKSISLRYQHYNRSDGLKANIVSSAIKFILN